MVDKCTIRVHSYYYEEADKVVDYNTITTDILPSIEKLLLKDPLVFTVVVEVDHNQINTVDINSVVDYIKEKGFDSLILLYSIDEEDSLKTILFSTRKFEILDNLFSIDGPDHKAILELVNNITGVDYNTITLKTIDYIQSNKELLK